MHSYFSNTGWQVWCCTELCHSSHGSCLSLTQMRGCESVDYLEAGLSKYLMLKSCNVHALGSGLRKWHRWYSPKLYNKHAHYRQQQTFGRSQCSKHAVEACSTEATGSAAKERPLKWGRLFWVSGERQMIYLSIICWWCSEQELTQEIRANQAH